MGSSSKINTASCCCGQASISLKKTFYRQVVCHCENCKKRTSNESGISLYFKAKQVIQQRGVMGIENIHTLNLKHDHSSFYCSQCGITLYWVLSNYPDVIGVASGCFDDFSLIFSDTVLLPKKTYECLEKPMD